MPTTPCRMVTIIAEPVLEERLTRELAELGASGWTITDVRGAGSRGIRASEVPGESIRVESVVGADVAERVLAHVASHYFTNYAVIAWVADVAVVRGEKYV